MLGSQRLCRVSRQATRSCFIRATGSGRARPLPSGKRSDDRLKALGPAPGCGRSALRSTRNARRPAASRRSISLQRILAWRPNRRDEAVADFRKAFALDPQNPLVHITREGLSRLGATPRNPHPALRGSNASIGVARDRPTCPADHPHPIGQQLGLRHGEVRQPRQDRTYRE